MTCNTTIQSKRSLSAKFAAGLALTAFLALGTFVPSASADQSGWDHRGDRQGWGQRGDCEYYNDCRHWHRTPPVVYGSPYYYPPPVVYGPGFGLSLPGLNLNIR
ncbi:MAG: hypothetical protein HQL37_11765 [Alphaproteobacteria bacterium]|nr:hypothetical protein [Alphaproteobacteria bacterium]